MTKNIKIKINREIMTLKYLFRKKTISRQNLRKIDKRLNLQLFPLHHPQKINL